MPFDPISYKKAQEIDERLSPRVLELEREIRTLQQTLLEINPNQEPKLTVEGVGQVSLPKNASKTPMSVGLKGVTAISYVANGNFRQGTTRWRSTGGTLVVDGTARVTGDGSLSYCHLIQDIALQLVEGHKYYARSVARVRGSDCQRLALELREVNLRTIMAQASPAQDQWYTLSGIVTISGPYTAPYFRVISNYADASGAVGKVLEVALMVLVDLTATFGAGNEPDKETCDKIFANWFDGTTSVPTAMRVKSVGKNLVEFDRIQWFNAGLDTNRVVLSIGSPATRLVYRDSASVEFTHSLAAFQGIGFVLKVENGNYRLSANFERLSPTGTTYVYYSTYSDYQHITDKNLAKTWGDALNSVIYVPEGANYLVIGFILSGSTSDTKRGRISQIQLEPGSIANSYEPYTETAQYISAPGHELRSLPNGVRDETRDGKIVQWVSEPEIIDGSLPLSEFNTYGDFYRVRIVGWCAGKNIVTLVNGTGLVFSDDGHYLVTSASPVQNRGVTFHDNGNLYIRVESSKINAMPSGATLAGFAEYLNRYPITIYYQLARPIEIPLPTTGALLSNPSGHVFVEPVVADAGVYKQGLSVLHTEYPIESLEKLSKIDFETGLETPLNPATAVISGDRLSFTHPDLQDGDLVFFTYYYPAHFPVPGLAAEFYDSRYVVQDSVTGKHYAWTVAVANGTPSIQLTEV